jgi:hypothetical protein
MPTKTPNWDELLAKFEDLERKQLAAATTEMPAVTRRDYKLEDLDAQMGLRDPALAIKNEGRRLELPAMTPAQAKAYMARKAGQS